MNNFALGVFVGIALAAFQSVLTNIAFQVWDHLGGWSGDDDEDDDDDETHSDPGPFRGRLWGPSADG